jgi:hypothetical protein
VNLALRTKFCAALRSGEYKQTRGRMREFKDAFCYEVDGYCATGVLINVLDKKLWDVRTYQNGASGTPISVIDPVHALLLKHSDLVDLPELKLLVGWNDGNKLTFAQIADKVEELL